MTRSVLVACFCLLLVCGTVFGQTDRGTITGTITDPVGAVVPGATIEARNINTGAIYQAGSTETGNYTLAQLPAGVYELSASLQGFKKFVRTGITVLVAQTLRIDINLEVGDITETVTVSADAALLRTESGELSHNVTSQRLDELPMLSISSGIRNPMAVAQLIPGSNTVGGIRLGGTPANTQNLRIEGQDTNNTLWSVTPTMTQPSVDAIEEYSVQTSNYSAEFGQAGGAVFNVTMRSGTNNLHGSAFEYFTNEAFNAKQAYLNERPRERQNDYGFTIGGPVYIPRLYDGRDKLFFFFSFEQFRETTMNNTPQTVPTEAFRNGDFSAILTGRQLAVDPLDRPIMENTIYDPATERIVNGQRIRDPFLNNQIPVDRFDPVAINIQNMMPSPTTTSSINNFLPQQLIPRTQTIPSIKMDYQISSRSKLSGYWSMKDSISHGGADGFPNEISSYMNNVQTSHTTRINFDYTLSPTMLLHLGAGHMYLWFGNDVPNTNFDSLKELGLKGTVVTRFPTITGLQAPQGGIKMLGPNDQQNQYFHKPTGNASFTWVKNNHTFKAGAEMRLEGFFVDAFWPGNGNFTFSNIETGLPSTEGQNLGGGRVGFPYASFLLGMVNNGTAGASTKIRLGKSGWALFAQDTWKVTPKFTLDYGLRWDYQTYYKEHHGRLPSISPNVPNPAAGNLPGGVVFEATVGDFASNYPYAIQPRLGAAYQITPKTVFRAGWGISYGQTPAVNFWGIRFGSNVPYSAPAYGTPAMLLREGVPIQPEWPNFDPGQFPLDPSSPSYFLTMIDHNAGRPPRLMMWSIGIQREITTNLAVEASYVGNRGAWWTSSIYDVNRLTPQILSANGIDISKAEDRDLLNSPLNSPLAAARGFDTPPYPGFSRDLTVSQALRPYPQFTGINLLWAPLGNTWYDSLQVKLTKRLSYGLDLTASYSWQKELNIGAESEDPYVGGTSPSVNNSLVRQVNKYLSGNSQPHRLVIAGNYRLPTLNTNKFLSWAIRDWTFGAVFQYQSGQPIRVPYANNQLGTLLKLCAPVNVMFAGCQGTGTFANRVPGEPLFSADLNNKNVDPNTTFFLNPDAWDDPPPGQYGTSAAYYDDYRYQRRPSESMSLGRIFRIGERANLNIRIEFTNLFNRTQKGNPSSSNAGSTQRVDSNGKPLSGFGYINTGRLAAQPRMGQLVARIQF
jgi:hypothetical protein